MPVSPKPGLIGAVVTDRGSGIKSPGGEGAHCLSAQLQCAVPVICSAGMPVSGLEDRIGTGWEDEQ